MKPTGGSVDEFIAGVTPVVRRDDAHTLVGLFREATGLEPELWGTIIGFGACHYRYPTGTEGDMPLAAFAPRKASSTVYVMDGFEHYADQLARLGPHTTSKSCLYLKDLARNDLSALREIIRISHERFLSGSVEGMDITVTS